MSAFYLAPLEGITGYIYRNAVAKHFGKGIDKYYSPFLMPHIKVPMTKKEQNDIEPSNNKDVNLVPQILTNDSAGFSFLEKALRDLGYEEINLNLGCPSKTVANKGRGSGFLMYPDKLDKFLYEIYEKAGGVISIKTRIGDSDPDEFHKILEIYNKYPVHELTIHPRLKVQGYSGNPYTSCYIDALKDSKNPVCYNGDICTRDDFDKLCNESGKATDNMRVMIGRGMIANPGLIRELSSGVKITSKELLAFLKQLEDDYSSVLFGETHVLFKMKEAWSYMGRLFPDEEKLLKKLYKAKHLNEYEMLALEIVNRLKY